MTTTLLTSRSGILSSKITAENKHHETLTDPSTILRDASLPKVKEQTSKLLQDKAIGRTGEESVAANVGGCSSCVLKDSLRGSGAEEGTTNKGVTRCVEINDRIVCYPVKTRATTPIAAS
ncbi:hypothetical protein O0L34_g7681 [Tuta absoluta]|nr:hypothetical protein O0L34_g7681 [Tuta absoluta]